MKYKAFLIFCLELSFFYFFILFINNIYILLVFFYFFYLWSVYKQLCNFNVLYRDLGSLNHLRIYGQFMNNHRIKNLDSFIFSFSNFKNFKFFKNKPNKIM